MLPFHHHHRHHPSTTGVNDQQTGEQVRTPRKEKWLYSWTSFYQLHFFREKRKIIRSPSYKTIP